MSFVRRTILGIFAHPDDESMGPGGTFAKYARLGHRVAFLTATEGGAGRLFEERPDDEAGRRKLKEMRRRETEVAAEILGAESLGFLGWEDGGLAERNVLEVEAVLAETFRREKPDVVVTFHGSGISYHPDHRVISLAVQGAFLGAGREQWYREENVAALAPHAPKKLYAMTLDRDAPYLDDWPREIYASPSAEITTVIDTTETADVKWEAIQAHATQAFGPPFRRLYEAGAFLQERFVRIFPTPASGDSIETDLLEGLT